MAVINFIRKALIQLFQRMQRMQEPSPYIIY